MPEMTARERLLAAIDPACSDAAELGYALRLHDPAITVAELRAALAEPCVCESWKRETGRLQDAVRALLGGKDEAITELRRLVGWVGNSDELLALTESEAKEAGPIADALREMATKVGPGTPWGAYRAPDLARAAELLTKASWSPSRSLPEREALAKIIYQASPLVEVTAEGLRQMRELRGDRDAVKVAASKIETRPVPWSEVSEESRVRFYFPVADAVLSLLRGEA